MPNTGLVAGARSPAALRRPWDGTAGARLPPASPVTVRARLPREKDPAGLGSDGDRACSGKAGSRHRGCCAPAWPTPRPRDPRAASCSPLPYTLPLEHGVQSRSCCLTPIRLPCTDPSLPPAQRKPLSPYSSEQPSCSPGGGGAPRAWRLGPSLSWPSRAGGSLQAPPIAAPHAAPVPHLSHAARWMDRRHLPSHLSPRPQVSWPGACPSTFPGDSTRPLGRDRGAAGAPSSQGRCGVE